MVTKVRVMKVNWGKISEAEYLLVALQIVHECQMCGTCCQRMDGIAYCAVDAERMAKHLNMKKNDWMREMTVPSTRKKGDRWLKLTEGEKKCPYLTDHGCSVYPGRGQVCRNYPWASAEQIEAARSHQPLRMYPKCPGMPITYKKYTEASLSMGKDAAEAVVKSDIKKYCYLNYIASEGRGEAARYAAKDLGLEDVPEEGALKNMARAYVIATLALIPEEARKTILKQVMEVYKLD
jgi:Fe-S-cluster containining protein